MTGKKILGMALLVAGLTATSATAADLWLHIKVHEDGGEKASINMPLSMIQGLASSALNEARTSGRIRVHDNDFSVRELRRIWRQLEDGPDATYVTVEETNSKVRIGKRGRYLHMEAKEHGKGGEDMEARIPLEVVGALLSGSGEELNIGAAMEALARYGEGDLLTVNSEKETVRIWVDDSPESK